MPNPHATHTQEQQIFDNGDLRKYRTELPNMADDELDPFEYRLYAHYKRVCGARNEGMCWESVRTTAKKTRMSLGQVVDTRDRLATMGWIEIHAASNTQSLLITLPDRWLENLLRYTPDEDLEKLGLTRSSSEQPDQTVHGVNSTVHGVNSSIDTQAQPNCSPHEPKNKQYITTEEETTEETTAASRVRAHAAAAPDSPPRQNATNGAKHAPSLDPRLIHLIDQHNLDIKPHQLAQWCEQHDTETVVEIARWYVHGRRAGKIRGSGWMNRAIQDEYGCPPEGFDRSLYLTPDEQQAIHADRADSLPAESSSEEDQAYFDSLAAAREEKERQRQQYRAEQLVALGLPPDYTPPEQARTLWDMAFGQLELQMPREAFDTWVRGVWLVACADNEMILATPNVYAREWLEHRLKKIITRTLSQIAGRNTTVRFELWDDAGPLLVGKEM